MISSQYSLPDYDLVRKLARSVGYNDHRWLAWQLDLSSWLPAWPFDVQSQHLLPYLQYMYMYQLPICQLAKYQEGTVFPERSTKIYDCLSLKSVWQRTLLQKPKLNLTY